MIIGVPKEIKIQEFRVGLTPAGVQGLTATGHQVYVQASAGEGSGLSDAQYVASGAQILATAAEVYAIADMIVKVKEPLADFDPLIPLFHRQYKPHQKQSLLLLILLKQQNGNK